MVGPGRILAPSTMMGTPLVPAPHKYMSWVLEAFSVRPFPLA
jgi:hypothetical protein